MPSCSYSQDTDAPLFFLTSSAISSVSPVKFTEKGHQTLKLCLWLPKSTGSACICTETSCKQLLWGEEETGTTWLERGPGETFGNQGLTNTAMLGIDRMPGDGPVVTETDVLLSQGTWRNMRGYYKSTEKSQPKGRVSRLPEWTRPWSNKFLSSSCLSLFFLTEIYSHPDLF